MAVTITKPEINLREKLKELDFETVPFQKMPSGSVIQVVHSSFNTQTEITSTSYTFTGLSASMAPRSNSSKILILLDFLCEVRFDSTSPQFGELKIQRDSNIVAERNARSRDSADASVKQNPVNFSILEIDAPNTTSPVLYEVFARVRLNSDNGSLLFNHVGDTGGTGSTMTLMEIAE